MDAQLQTTMETPAIDFSHVLGELSVNRNDPCEVIRELISNAYDAGANNMWVVPLVQFKTFIFVDDGTGISGTTVINGITPWRAFFSIGRGTKKLGTSIGYKCQGTKLCFASTRFKLLTRCTGEDQWRYKMIDNPKTNLTTNYSLAPMPTTAPWDEVTRFFHVAADSNTGGAVSRIDEGFFKQYLKTGTGILVSGFEAEDFDRFFSTSSSASYLRDYIRFRTRHSDMRVLRPERTGFLPVHHKTFASQKLDYKDTSTLHIWNSARADFDEMPIGFPYLAKPAAAETLSSPSKLTRLGDGSFFYRNASSFTLDDRVFNLTLAVDGWKRVRDAEDYASLSRQGRAGSGIRLVDQRGAMISSTGVPVGPFYEIFDSALLEEYAVLKEQRALLHYLLIVDGRFELVTNRDTLAEAARRVVGSEKFAKKVKEFLDQSYKNGEVFREFMDRLRREASEQSLNEEGTAHENRRAKLRVRKRFQIASDGPLKGQSFFEPLAGEENLVAMLYSVLGYNVDTSSALAGYWRKTRTLRAGQGIDSFAVPLDYNGWEPDKHADVEFKWVFSPADEYNHALILTDDIIAWEIQGDRQAQIKDNNGYYGDWKKEDDNFWGTIGNLCHVNGNHNEKTVRVISLRELINRTFKVLWFEAPPER
jgi:hypothetical protein